MAAVNGQNPSGLGISDVKAWGSWKAAITVIDWNVRIDGIIARNELVMAFKDTLSDAYASDSLELTLPCRTIF